MSFDLDRLPERTRHFLEHGAPEGERQKGAFDAACQLRDAGATEAEAIQLVEAGAARCGLPLPEARAAAKSAFKRTPREPIHKRNGGEAMPAKRKIVGTYDYTDEAGRLLFQCVRYAPKDFRQRQPDGKGGWTWNLKGVRLVLYRLPEVVKASEAWIVEGEKDCDTLAALGLCATCNPLGAEKWRDEYNEALRGKSVVIVPDNDAPGRRHVEKVTQALQDVAASVKIVKLPDTVKDASDYVATFSDAADAAERLAIMAEGMAEWTPTTVEPTRGAPVDAEWPEPKPLPDDLPAVPAFNFACLPDTLRPWLEDIAERMQCPPDFPSVAATVALGSLVGRKIGIRPKRYDDWLVVPNLWGAIVGRPGLMKTPAAEQALLPLRRLVAEALERYKAQSGEHKITALLKVQRVKLHERKIAEHLKDGDEASARAEAKASTSADDDEPVLRRYEVNDSTVAKLGELLAQNPNGLLVHRDELIGFLRGLDKEGAEESRAFYLESWNGTGSFTFDRIGRGTIRVESNTLAILGGIQPDLLTSYVREAVRGGMGADGLLQRFQLAVWPDIARGWQNVDRWPDTGAKNEAFCVFKYLDGLDPAEIGADGSSGIPFLRFDSAAQDCFDQWRARLEAKLRDDSEHPAFEAHLSKYRKLVPALALLVHLADRQIGPVTLAALDKALLWARYLEGHARRIYSAVLRPDTAAARELAKRLLRGEVGERFTLREVYRRGWAGLGAKEDAEAGTEILCDLGWIRPIAETGRTIGRPASPTFETNPKIRGATRSELPELTKPTSGSFGSEPTQEYRGNET
jgi:putative DNA primase/helicase